MRDHKWEPRVDIHPNMPSELWKLSGHERWILYLYRRRPAELWAIREESQAAWLSCIWRRCSLRVGNWCTCCGRDLNKGDAAYRPITGKALRSERICPGCVRSAAGNRWQEITGYRGCIHPCYGHPVLKSKPGSIWVQAHVLPRFLQCSECGHAPLAVDQPELIDAFAEFLQNDR